MNWDQGAAYLRRSEIGEEIVMIKCALSLLTLSLVTACSTATYHVEPDPIARVKKIAIVSLAGQELLLHHKNKGKHTTFLIPIDSWQMSDVFFDAVRSVLESQDRFIVSRLDVDLRDVRNSDRQTLREIKPRLDRVGALCGCDALLVIADAGCPDKGGGRGLGWSVSEGPFWEDRNYQDVRACYRLSLLDAKTLETLPAPQPFVGVSSGVFTQEGPFDLSLWMQPKDRVAESLRAEIQPMLERVVRESAPSAARRLGLLSTQFSAQPSATYTRWCLQFSVFGQFPLWCSRARPDEVAQDGVSGTDRDVHRGSSTQAP